MQGSTMDNAIWRHASPDYGHYTIDADGLDPVRGLLIGLAISQVFWLTLAWLIF